jgi:hypothetical protein
MLLMIWEVQRQTLLVMPEILVAIWALLAAIAFGRFIDTQDWRHSLWFGVFASLAILTKGNGWALALLPPSAILFSGKFKLIFHRALWIGAAVVAAVCVPWHVLTMALVRHVWLPANTRPNTLSAEYETARLFLMNVAGSTGAALCLAGFAVVIFGLVRRRFELPGQWASITALLLAVLVFHPLVPLPFELRKMLAAVPPFVMLAAAGVDALARAVRFIPLSRVVLFSAGMIAFSFHDLPAKYPAGFREAAIVAASQRLPLDVYLVSGSAGAEGAFIAEIAMHDRRPRRVVIRASKAFAESDSNMTRYRLLFDTTAAMQRELKRLSVGLIVVEDSPHANSIPHHSLLTRMLEELPREWAALPATESRDKLRRVRIFRRAASARVVE